MKWTEDQIRRLERAWSTKEDLHKVATELGRKLNAVQKYASRHGFGRKAPDMFSLSELERKLGYCRKTIVRAAKQLGYSHKHGRRWALGPQQVAALIETLKDTRATRV